MMGAQGRAPIQVSIVIALPGKKGVDGGHRTDEVV